MEQKSSLNWSTIIFLAALTIAFFTNPTYNTHIDKMKQEYKRKNPMTSIFLGKSFIRMGTEYHDMYLFSYTTLNKEIVSVGAFSKVGVTIDMDINSGRWSDRLFK